MLLVCGRWVGVAGLGEPFARVAATSPGTTLSSITVMTTGQAGAKGNLSLSVDVGAKPVCATPRRDLYVAHDQNFYGAVYTPDADTPQDANTITYTLFNTGNVQGIHLCFAAQHPFEQLDEGNAVAGTLPDGGSGFVGLLESCDPAEDGTTPDPCQTTATMPESGVSTELDTLSSRSTSRWANPAIPGSEGKPLLIQGRAASGARHTAGNVSERPHNGCAMLALVDTRD